MSTDDILSNAERLISDARYLHEGGHSRSAATLIVVALEQLGLFVAELTKQKYPDAAVHMGIFGGRANAHAKRQDALAAHVMNFVLSELTTNMMFEHFYEKTGCGDHDKFLQWLTWAVPFEFTEAQKRRLKDSPDMKTASLLMESVRQNRLQKLREYGFYENTELKFSDKVVQQVLELTEKVRVLLARSWVSPEPIQIAGINMPEHEMIPLEIAPRTLT